MLKALSPKRFGYLPTFITVAIVFINGLFLVWFIDKEIKSQLAAEFELAVDEELDRKLRIINQSTSNAINTLNFFFNTPPIEGILRAEQNNGVDPKENTPLTVWQERIGQIFSSYIDNKEQLFQARIIKFDEAGSELVRVTKQNNKIEVANKDQLQDKAHRDYYRSMGNLAFDQTYISPINLNRERGNIEYPLRPTQRVAKNIYFNDEEKYGFLIINIDANIIINELSQEIPQGLSLYLLDNKGGAIIHPERDKSFLHELNPNSQLPLQNSQKTKGLLNNFLFSQQKSRYFYKSKPIYFSPTRENVDLNLIVGFEESTFQKALTKRRTGVLAVICVLIGMVVTGIIFYQRKLSISKATAQSLAEYEAIIADSNDAIITMDEDSVIKSWNTAAEIIFGFSSREAKGRNLFALLKCTTNSHFNGELLKNVFLGHSESQIEAALQSKKGETLQTSITVSPVYFKPTMEIKSAAAIIRDISKQKAIENQIKELNTTLENRIKQRTEQLEKAKNEAIRANDLKSQFIANVSHEIRTPMNGVKGMLHLIESEPLSSRQKKFVDMAQSSASNLTCLINDILDLSKIEAGKLEVEKRDLNIVDLLSNVCMTMAVDAERKGLALMCDASAVSFPVFNSDENRIRQILINLIGNAIKFTHKGKIVITAKTQLLPGNNIEFCCSVRDTGIGIEKDFQKHLFQLFNQESTNITREYGGSGMGLAICKKLCKMLGGDIYLESTKSVGSTFTFEIVGGKRCATYAFEAEKAEFSDAEFYIAINDKDIKTTITNYCRLISNHVETGSNWLAELSEELKQNQHKRFILICDAHEKLPADFTQLDQLKVIRFYNNYKSQTSLTNRSLCLPLISANISLALGITQEQSPANEWTFISQPTSIKETLKQFTSAKILMVDDNQINLEVGRGMLENFGLPVETAASGEAALNLLSQAEYDLLILDCQMPGIDGYEVSRRLRSLSRDSLNQAIPIIAMTASAMSGSREECLNCGMNDFLTKPIEPNVLAEKLYFWLSMDTLTSSIFKPKNFEQQVFSMSHADNSIVNKVWNKQLVLDRLGGHEARIISLSDIYFETMPDRIQRLNEVCKKQLLDKLAIVAHEIQGIAANIGGEKLHKVSGRLEDAGKQGDVEACKALAIEVECAHEELEAALAEFQVQFKSRA